MRQLIAAREPGGTSHRPSLPRAGMGGNTWRMSLSSHANRPSSKVWGRAAMISSNTIGRTSVKTAVAMMHPSGWLAWMAKGPRYEVDQVRVSMVFSPRAIIDAHGCLRLRAFISGNILCSAKRVRTAISR